VNGKALEVSSITRDTKNPAGGEILRDARGDAVGFCGRTRPGSSVSRG